MKANGNSQVFDSDEAVEIQRIIHRLFSAIDIVCKR